MPHVVMMLIVDTVRSSNTSLCGYDRPNTPSLEDVRDKGALVTCQAYAPAPWTLPSHASFFTGLTVAQHGAQLVPESDIRISQHLQVRPLDDDYKTLAEFFQEIGFQTAALSANPVIRKNSGLDQGFDRFRVASGAGGGDDEEGGDDHAWRVVLRGENLLPELQSMLGRLDKRRPLFLFVNIFDAHVPYPAVPDDLGWIPETPGIRFAPTDEDPNNPFFQFTSGTMPDAEISEFLSQLTNLYDHGVYQADRNVGRVLKLMAARGWLDRGFRLVITSDHGELLGEHGVLRHGRYLYEPVVKVPFLYYDTTQRMPARLPEPFSAVHAYHLLRDGRLPDDPLMPQAVSERNPNFTQPGADAAAVWAGDEKLIWHAETEAIDLYNLRQDPGESRPLPSDGHELVPAMREISGQLKTLAKRPLPTVDMKEALKAVGYLADDEDEEDEEDDATEAPPGDEAEAESP